MNNTVKIIDFYNERAKRKMKDKGKGKRQVSEIDNKNEHKIFKKYMEHPITSTLLTALLVFVGFTSKFMMDTKSTLAELNVYSENSREQIKKMDEENNERDKNVEEGLDKLSDQVTTISGQLSLIAENFIDALKVTWKDNSLSPVVSTYEDGEIFNEESLKYNADDVIAIGVGTNKEYTAAELTGIKLLVPYKEDGQEIVFYGMYNKDYHWDGDCLINTYKDNVLKLVTLGKYSDGILLSYRQAYLYNDTWYVSERKRENGINEGTTFLYRSEEEWEKEFELENIKASDLIYPDDIISSVNDKLTGIYYGKTSDGRYNDETGNAYLVKLSDEGKVIFLYVGKFKDGQCNDLSGNAQQIMYDDSIDRYYYFKGNFENGKRKDNAKPEYLKKEDIEKKIAGIKVYQTLDWYEIK